MSGVTYALRPVLCKDVCMHIERLVRISNFAEVMEEIPIAGYNFFIRMVRAYIDERDDDEVCYSEYLGWWELAFPDQDNTHQPHIDYNYYYNHGYDCNCGCLDDDYTQPQPHTLYNDDNDD